MSKMNELSAAVTELHKCAEALVGVADTLQNLFSTEQKSDPSLPITEPQPKQPKLEDVRAVLARKSIEGHTEEVQALIMKYGADKLSKIEPVNYFALLADAEAL